MRPPRRCERTAPAARPSRGWSARARGSASSTRAAASRRAPALGRAQRRQHEHALDQRVGARRGPGSARRAARAGSRTRAGRSRRRAPRRPSAYSPAWASLARLRVGREGVLGGLGRHDRVIDLAQAGDQVGPLAGLEHRERLLAELLVRAEQRLEARRGCGRRGRPSPCVAPPSSSSEMIWCGCIVPWSASAGAPSARRSRPAPGGRGSGCR